MLSFVLYTVSSITSDNQGTLSSTTNDWQWSKEREGKTKTTHHQSETAEPRLRRRQERDRAMHAAHTVEQRDFV